MKGVGPAAAVTRQQRSVCTVSLQKEVTRVVTRVVEAVSAELVLPHPHVALWLSYPVQMACEVNLGRVVVLERRKRRRNWPPVRRMKVRTATTTTMMTTAVREGRMRRVGEIDTHLLVGRMLAGMTRVEVASW